MKLFVARGEREWETEVVPSNGGFAVTVGGRPFRVEGTVGKGAMRVLLDGRPVEATARREGAEVVVSLRGESFVFRVRDARAPKLQRRSAGADLTRGNLHAPMPGLVVEVLAAEGDPVDAGQPLDVVEAMKMQNAFAAPLAGRITRIAVKPGMPVESGQLLVAIAPGTE
jgi:biotin carboxyl carrier protein